MYCDASSPLSAGNRVGFFSSADIWNDKRDLCVGSEAEYECGRNNF